MERAWEVIRSVGGVLLLIELMIWLMGSAHAGHPLRNSREFGEAFDQVTGAIVNEVVQGVRWVGARGQ
jgi:hypothetical protein